MVDKDLLGEILFDVTLREAFHSHLDSCLMVELLDLWSQLESFFELDDSEKTEQFMFICNEFMLPDSPALVNHSYELLAGLRNLHKEVGAGGLTCVPPDSLEPCRVATLDLLAYTCLPVFLSSDIYKDFKDGTVDSSKAGFSRYKAEQFFGMKIEGPLTRADKVPINYGHYRRRGKPGFFSRLFAKQPPKSQKNSHHTPNPTLRNAQSLSSTSSMAPSSSMKRSSTTELFGGASDDDKAMGIYGLM